ncbi:MAG: ABC transporter permease [Bacteroidota bacterium]
MKQILNIIRREFVTRVRSGSFIVFTLLAPIIFILPFVFLMIWQAVSSPPTTVAVVDDYGLFEDKRDKFLAGGMPFVKMKAPLDSVKNKITEETDTYIGLLYVPENLVLEGKDGQNIQYIVKDRPSDPKKYAAIEQYVNEKLLKAKLLSVSSTEVNVDALSQSYHLEDVTLNPKNFGLIRIATTMAYIMGMVMYLMLIVYTNSLVKGVMEEKQNRIVEVISMVVKPFHLMLGKIIGIGLVGLVQLIIGFGLASLFIKLVKWISTLAFDISFDQQVEDNGSFFDLQSLLSNYTMLPLTKIMIFVPIFFICGFLLNGAISAAIGSTTNEEGDASLAFLGNFMNIIAIYVAMLAVGFPESTFAEVSLYIPFLSPIVLPAMLPYDLPLWKILLSLSILIGTFFLMTYYAAKIYRLSILTYGNKIRVKDIVQMIRTA